MLERGLPAGQSEQRAEGRSLVLAAQPPSALELRHDQLDEQE